MNKGGLTEDAAPRQWHSSWIYKQSCECLQLGFINAMVDTGISYELHMSACMHPTAATHPT
jgi:hypothetical protein